jgi:hypothetical protein
MKQRTRNFLDVALHATTTLFGIVATIGLMLVVAAFAFDFFARTLEAHIR